MTDRFCPHDMAVRVVSAAESGRLITPRHMIAKLQSGDFALGSLKIHFQRQQSPQGHEHLACVADIGNLPYTVESPDGRQTITAVMTASQALRYARFHLNEQGRVQLAATLPLPTQPADEDIILAVLDLYRETAPLLTILNASLKTAPRC